MTEQERLRFLKKIKQMIVVEGNRWYLDICSSDFDLKWECSDLEDYKRSFNYLVGQLLRDKEI